jgi:heme/copper-type cytochrome/quinol oxidase subunit 2
MGGDPATLDVARDAFSVVERAKRDTKMLSSLALLLIAGGGFLLTAQAAQVSAQEQAPTRRPVTIVAKDFRFEPDRVEVTQDDLVRVTVTSADVAYGFTIDKFRISKRVPAGESITFEFRADQAGPADFYSNMTNDARHAKMRGQLIVRAK